MKRVFAFVLAALMTAALAGCGNSASSSQAGSSLSSHEESAASSVVESSQEESATAGTGMKDGKTMDDFMTAMKDLYSDLSLTPIDDAMLKDLYMVDPENVDSYVGEMSMINVQAFDILVVKAKEGKVEDVKASLEERKQNRISEFEFYPVNNNAVSYTHLDVYKRQDPQDQGDDEWAGACRHEARRSAAQLRPGRIDRRRCGVSGFAVRTAWPICNRFPG